MMQKFTLKLILTSVAGLILSTSWSQELTVLWPADGNAADLANSQFDGGLNDWQSVGLFNSGDAPDDTPIWNWQADAEANEGNFAGEMQPIISLSPENGAAVFDSDFNDNGGTATFASGPLPCTQANGSGNIDGMGHRGELISPSIDCSNWDRINLRFNQYYRVFRQSETSALVSVSNDGGNSWNDIRINDELANNASTDQNSLVLLDISEWAAFQSDVRIRFAFQGCYYFWVIDDIQLIEPPEIDANFESYFYGVNYATPTSQIVDDSVGFSAVINNKQQDLINARVAVTIEELDGDLNVEQVLYTDTTEVVPALSRGLDTLFFDGTWAPGNLDTGAFNMRYDLLADNLDNDFDPSDNSTGSLFTTTTNRYAMEDGLTTGLRPGDGGEYALGAMYRTSNTWGNIEYLVDNISFEVVVNPEDEPLLGKEVDIYLLEINDDIAPSFADFDLDGGFLENPSYTLVAFQNYDLTSDGGREEINTSLIDFNGADVVTLKPNTFYFFVAHYIEGNEVIFHGCNDVDFIYDRISTVTYGNQWFLGGFGDDVQAMMRVDIDNLTSVDAPSLPEASFNVSPNPATDYVQVDINLEEPSEAQIIVTTVEGKVVRFDEYDNLQKESMRLDVSSYGAGAYLMHLNTPKGIATEKVIITK